MGANQHQLLACNGPAGAHRLLQQSLRLPTPVGRVEDALGELDLEVHLETARIDDLIWVGGKLGFAIEPKRAVGALDRPRPIAVEAGLEVSFSDHPFAGKEIDHVGRRCHGHQFDVGHDAHALDTHIAGRQILRDRQLERRAVGQLVEHLHAALAETPVAHNQGPAVVLEGSGDDLTGRRAARVDQDHDRVGRLGARLGRLFLIAKTVTLTDRRHDRAVVEERVGHADRLLQQAARVVPQIEHQPVDLAHLLAQAVEMHHEIAVGVCLEVADTDIADAITQHVALHTLDTDVLAHNRELVGRRPTLPHDLDRDRCSRLSTEAAHRLLDVHVDGGLLTDLEDLVTRTKASPVGGCAVDGADDGQLAAADRDHDAQATEAASVVGLHIGEDFGREQHAVGIERVEHAVDCGVLHQPQVDLVVLQVGLHEAEDLAQPEAHLPQTRDLADLEGLDRVIDLQLHLSG